jgi:hypothetical protein
MIKILKARNSEFRYSVDGQGDVKIMVSPSNVSPDASGMNCVSISFDDLFCFFEEIVGLYGYEDDE